MKKLNNRKVFRITITALLAAAALALSYTEKLLLAAFPLPMGIKPGFSNIIVMFTCSTAGLLPALGIAVVKSCFATFMSGTASGFISLCGGLVSVLMMFAAIRLSKGKLSYTGISVISSVAHNMGQLTAASLIAGSNLFIGYTPVLLISGVIFGVITGIVLNLTMPHLMKLKIFDSANFK